MDEDLTKDQLALSRMLLDLPSMDAMGISELDGFFAGLLVCPEMIMPGEWLPPIGGAEEDDDELPLETVEEMKIFTSLVMSHYNTVAESLMAGPGKFRPIFDYIERKNVETEIMWEIWISGFERAMHLHPDGFSAHLDTKEETVGFAVAGLRAMMAISSGTSGFDRAVMRETSDAAPEFIPFAVDVLHAVRIGRPLPPLSPVHPRRPGALSTRSQKVGRNQPCPCGSGKKYKKCCGLN